MHSPIFFITEKDEESKKFLKDDDNRSLLICDLTSIEDPLSNSIQESDYVKITQDGDPDSQNWGLDCLTSVVPYSKLTPNTELGCHELTITKQDILSYQKELSKNLKTYAKLLDFCAKKKEPNLKYPTTDFIEKYKDDIAKFTSSPTSAYFHVSDYFNPYGGLKFVMLDDMTTGDVFQNTITANIYQNAEFYYNYTAKDDTPYTVFILDGIQGDYHY